MPTDFSKRSLSSRQSAVGSRPFASKIATTLNEYVPDDKHSSGFFIDDGVFVGDAAYSSTVVRGIKRYRILARP